jgi:hypothetical protein
MVPREDIRVIMMRRNIRRRRKEVIYKFKPCNSAGEIEDPQCKLGMVFDSMEQLRTTVSQYAVKTEFKLRRKGTTIRGFWLTALQVPMEN